MYITPVYNNVKVFCFSIPLQGNQVREQKKSLSLKSYRPANFCKTACPKKHLAQKSLFQKKFVQYFFFNNNTYLLFRSKNKGEKVIRKIVFFLDWLLEYFLTFGGLVPQKNDLQGEEKEEYISTRDLQDIIINNLKALENQAEEKSTSIMKKLDDVLSNKETTTSKQNQPQQSMGTEELECIEHKGNPLMDVIKEENSFEENLNDKPNDKSNPSEMHQLKQELHDQNKELQNVVELLKSLKTKESNPIIVNDQNILKIENEVLKEEIMTLRQENDVDLLKSLKTQESNPNIITDHNALKIENQVLKEEMIALRQENKRLEELLNSITKERENIIFSFKNSTDSSDTSSISSSEPGVLNTLNADTKETSDSCSVTSSEPGVYYFM